MESFVRGEVYPSVTALYFDAVVNDLTLREILHPTMFVVSTANKKVMKTNVFTPTEKQRKGFRALFDLFTGTTTPGPLLGNIPSLTNSTRTDNDLHSQNLGHLPNEGVPSLPGSS